MNALAGPPNAIGGASQGSTPSLSARASVPVSTASTPGARLGGVVSID